MNTKLVDSLIKVILSLSKEERHLLDVQILRFAQNDMIESNLVLMQMAQKGGSFNFLYDEPNLYTLDDGEPI